jgi:hypothetical protein
MLFLALVACGDKGADEAGAPALSKSDGAPEAASASAPPASTSADEAAVEKAFASPGSAIVDLAGNYNAPPPIPDGAPRVAVRALSAQVFAKPNSDAKVIGFLRAGAIVQADETDHGKAGCPGGWRGIYPAGFVCIGDKVTEKLDDPIVLATQRRPDLSQKLPYMYGTVTRGGPAYSRIPTESDLAEFEPGLQKHIKKWKEVEEPAHDLGLGCVGREADRYRHPEVLIEWRLGAEPVGSRQAGPREDRSGRSQAGRGIHRELLV